jgi:hypothetical protein
MNLNDMTAYSSDMSILYFNFSAMARNLTLSMPAAINEAFRTSGNQFHWSAIMGQISDHNATQLGNFMTNSGTAAFNVAMAAQTVANVISDADTTGAANINSLVEFAFGDRSKMPANMPDEYKKNLKTTAELAAAGQPAPGSGTVQGNPDTALGPGVPQADGSLLYTIALGPDKDGNPQTMQVRETHWSTYPGGPSGTTKTTTINGRQTTSVDTSSSGFTTTTTTTTSYYDEKGNRVDHVTGVKKETADLTATTVTTKTDTTSYSYDADGKKQLDETTTTEQETVGIENQEQDPKVDPRNDPLAESRANGLG